MSADFSIHQPTAQEIADFMTATGCDESNARRSLLLKAGLDAVNAMKDLDDAKKLLRVIIRRIVPLLD